MSLQYGYKGLGSTRKRRGIQYCMSKTTKKRKKNIMDEIETGDRKGRTLQHACARIEAIELWFGSWVVSTVFPSFSSNVWLLTHPWLSHDHLKFIVARTLDAVFEGKGAISLLWTTRLC